MCGIVGIIGVRDVEEQLLRGLEKLEYRGYDSAGIAVFGSEGVNVFKEKGRIAALREAVAPDASASLGIGHTRWATHGAPSRRNAHPHRSAGGRFTIVHNGVIENYAELKRTMLRNVSFQSDTDTEVVAHLVESLANRGLGVEAAFRTALSMLRGSYAIAMLDEADPGVIYAAKQKSPLLIGVGDGFAGIASDAMAMLHLTNEFIEIMDGETVTVTREGAVLKDAQGKEVRRTSFVAKLNVAELEKGPYAHYMMKEMDEQPGAIRRLLAEYVDEDGRVSIPEDVRAAAREADRIYIVACGTSYHAGLVGKQLLESVAGIKAEAHVASEFLYNPPLLSERPLFVFISQSGETADSRGVLVRIRELGHKTLTITNVPGSTLSREADYTLHTFAGPEIAVASTKAYTTQIGVLAVFACDCARARGVEVAFDVARELSLAANAMEVVINEKEKMESLVWEYLSSSRNCFFIGRAMDYYICLEGALKLKEVSYIQAEGFAGGELKHGTIALIEEGTPVVAVSTQRAVKHSIRSNAQEVIARGANVCMISIEGLEEAGDALVLPKVHEALAPLIAAVPLQFFAYYAALYRGCDVDKPRNLAKSVTVE
ncbi:glutamine--fructose-6-phosphate transaminase (isomerizing) [Paenibacillus antri]|uniref:Glutamine--fructose-6-phosphate aminotransferase [isomerizing] n=1 Tax=Paenibacillus antri TaxID=2582848 RepID=A0A5R9G5L0_9BACL|nr:glutamine--fructose-6-phosphate transaminase (isomerizing) [Paenibacillus antri]TLS49420.1 glutamine--fructose-6-phosphate transaminase (isomerizing) [Paenibacillus antri]